MKFKKEIYRQTREVAKTLGLKLGKAEYEQMVRNFKRGQVWIPYTHSNDPRDNVGFVDSLYYSADSNSLWMIADIVDEEAQQRISDGLVKDVSVSVYEEGGEWFLEHVALTMNPGVKPQKPFKQMERIGESIQCENLTNFEEVNEMKVTEEKETTKVEEEVGEAVSEEVEVVQVDEEKKTELESTKEKVELEEAGSLFKKIINRFSSDEKEKIKKVELENKGLKTELESTKGKVVELEGVVESGKSAVMLLEEEKRVKEWNLTFDEFLGKKAVPAEKELLVERISNPEDLRTELEARADLGLQRKTVELENTGKEDWKTGLPDEEVNFVKRQGWDKEERKDLLNMYLSLREEEK